MSLDVIILRWCICLALRNGVSDADCARLRARLRRLPWTTRFTIYFIMRWTQRLPGETPRAWLMVCWRVAIMVDLELRDWAWKVTQDLLGGELPKPRNCPCTEDRRAIAIAAPNSS